MLDVPRARYVCRNFLIEAFVPPRPFILIISPVFLTLALLGVAGAATWERTGSLVLAVISGVCCAIVAVLITLCFAISFNLLFAARVDWQLREAFAASGMIDRAAFRVKNILEASYAQPRTCYIPTAGREWVLQKLRSIGSRLASATRRCALRLAVRRIRSARFIMEPALQAGA